MKNSKEEKTLNRMKATEAKKATEERRKKLAAKVIERLLKADKSKEEKMPNAKKCMEERCKDLKVFGNVICGDEWFLMQEEYVHLPLLKILHIKDLVGLVVDYHGRTVPIQVDLLMLRCCGLSPILMDSSILGISKIDGEGITVVSSSLQCFTIDVRAASIECHSLQRITSPSICPLAPQNIGYMELLRGGHGHLTSYEVRFEVGKQFVLFKQPPEQDDSPCFETLYQTGWHDGQQFTCYCTRHLSLRVNELLSTAYIALSPFLAHDQLTIISAFTSHYQKK